MAESFFDWLSAWDDWRVEVEELRELDDERVLVLTCLSGRGKTSGIEVNRAKGAGVFHVRDGRVVTFITYWDRDRALADLGLKE